MLLAVAALLTVGALVFTLLVRSTDIHEEPAQSPVDHLEERKQLVYENLRDLQFEFRVGKLSEEDYQKTKHELQKELERVTGQIDAAGGSGAASPEPRPAQPSAARVCPHCAAEFENAMKFCGECGKPMTGGPA